MKIINSNDFQKATITRQPTAQPPNSKPPQTPKSIPVSN